MSLDLHLDTMKETDESPQNSKISLILTAYSHALSAAVVPQLAYT